MTARVIAALVLALSTANLTAQVRVVRYTDDRLVGIDEVDVLVTVPPSPQGTCPVDRTAIQQSAVTALRARNVKATISEKGRSWHYSVLVDLLLAPAASACATAITTELVAEVAGIPDADNARPADAWGSLLVGFMSLWRGNALVVRDHGEHASAVQQAVDAHVAAIASGIRSANP